MAYITQSGGTIAAATGDLTDFVGNPLLAVIMPDGSGGISAAIASVCIAAADGYINAKLANHYTVPFSPVPDLIKHLSKELAIVTAYDAKPEFAKDEKNPVEYMRENANTTLDMLCKETPYLVVSATSETFSANAITFVDSDEPRDWAIEEDDSD